ncbi:MAG: 4-(cytidine 5'-diphospho)-2-C-methyl-D-erythritol kinase [Miltoncostaeaceae bacterium]
MDALTVRARPKINLQLAVGPVGEDGYHPLRSLMVELDAPCDTLRLRRAPARSVDSAEAPGESNLCWAAIEALERRVGRELPVAVEIDKRIPAQAGLGGGSSDAASTLRACVRLFGLDLSDDDLVEVAAEVGSDVPFFVRGGAQWATGRGERLTTAASPRFAAVVTRPDARLSTSAVYGAFDRLAPPAVRASGEPPDMPALAGWARNDLWPVALALSPRLAATARALTAAGARATLLCGSGSCVAGLADDVAHAERILGRLEGVKAWVARPHVRTGEDVGSLG